MGARSTASTWCSGVPDHSERVVGDGEDECGIRATGATTIPKHQDTESDGEVYTDDNDEGKSEYPFVRCISAF